MQADGRAREFAANPAHAACLPATHVQANKQARRMLICSTAHMACNNMHAACRALHLSNPTWHAMACMHAALQGIAGSVEALQGAMQRVRGEVSDMCTRMRSQNRQAANLHAAADLVRALLHRLKLANKLKALLTSEGQTAGEPSKALNLQTFPCLQTSVETCLSMQCLC